jgi:hypothetical protein
MNLLGSDEIAGMRDTVFNVQLDHTCIIQRRSQIGTDPTGNPIFSWTNLLVDEPCPYWESSEEELIGNETAILTRRRLVIQPNRGVEPQDRVTQLIGYDNVVVANEMNILHVLDRVNESVLMLEEIS